MCCGKYVYVAGVSGYSETDCCIEGEGLCILGGPCVGCVRVGMQYLCTFGGPAVLSSWEVPSCCRAFGAGRCALQSEGVCYTMLSTSVVRT